MKTNTLCSDPLHTSLTVDALPKRILSYDHLSFGVKQSIINYCKPPPPRTPRYACPEITINLNSQSLIYNLPHDSKYNRTTSLNLSVYCSDKQRFAQRNYRNFDKHILEKVVLRWQIADLFNLTSFAPFEDTISLDNDSSHANINLFAKNVVGNFCLASDGIWCDQVPKNEAFMRGCIRGKICDSFFDCPVQKIIQNETTIFLSQDEQNCPCDNRQKVLALIPAFLMCALVRICMQKRRLDLDDDEAEMGQEINSYKQQADFTNPASWSGLCSWPSEDNFEKAPYDESNEQACLLTPQDPTSHSRSLMAVDEQEEFAYHSTSRESTPKPQESLEETTPTVMSRAGELMSTSLYDYPSEPPPSERASYIRSASQEDEEEPTTKRKRWKRRAKARISALVQTLSELVSPTYDYSEESDDYTYHYPHYATQEDPVKEQEEIVELAQSTEDAIRSEIAIAESSA
ncbi:hypothetical protein Ciccas_006043 [Cichlidogyrus casuarinus]|uniref:Uncharacterized protein n=1 Tax=Cichlidogyrus casuarinus TaxID=1844966 RepID=A0ABD2Q9C0_9PLAT